MKNSLLGLLIVGLLVAAEDKPKADEAVKKDLEKLKGTWVVTAMEFGGKKAPEEAIKGMSMTFDGDKVSFKQPDKTEKGTFKIDPGKKPAEMDILPTEGEDKGKTLKFIYALEGDVLKLGVSAKPDAARAKDFDDKDGGLMTLKKEQK